MSTPSRSVRPSPASGFTSAPVRSAERPNTIGLGGRDLASLLDKLDGADPGKSVSRRDFARWPFRRANVTFTVTHPGGSEANLRLACRNLSRGGISLLHTSYVHPGSPCRITLPGGDGTPRDLAGTVRRCIHRRGTLHEIGVIFDAEIDVRDFVGEPGGEGLHSLERVPMDQLVGKVLHVESSAIETRIVKHFLRETGLNLAHAATGAEALVAARGQDLLLIDSQLTDMTGIELLARLREAGVRASAIVLTPDPARTARTPSPPTDMGVLGKPLAQETLLRAIAERLIVRRDSRAASSAAPRASRAGAPIEGLADHLTQCAASLERALAAEDNKGVGDVCLQLRGAAPALGLDDLGVAATRTAGVLLSAPLVGAAGDAVRELAAACRRAAEAA